MSAITRSHTRRALRTWLAELDVSMDAALAMGDEERADVVLRRITILLGVVADAYGLHPLDWGGAREILESAP